MKKNEFDYVEDRINRYIYQVTKHMSPLNKKDIDNELRTLIYDMLETKNPGDIPSKADLDAVLKELGNPRELAEKYQDTSRYLIRPDLFPVYLLVLKIVLGATLFGMSIATILDLITSYQELWYSYIGTWLGNMLGSAISAFGYVTLIFAFIEWQGVNMKELLPDWDVDSLPPVPVKEAKISIGEPIAGIIFTMLCIILFTSAPQLISIYYFKDTLTVIPIFNLDTVKTVLPLFLITMALGLLKNIWELIDRNYSIPYAIFVFIINTISAVLTIIIFTGFDIWNPDFGEQITAAFQLDPGLSVPNIWNMITSNFVIFLIVVYILETLFIIIKALKYGNRYDFLHYIRTKNRC